MDTNPSLEEFVTHSEGFGECVFFSLLGRDYLLSCGSDGDIRVLDLTGEKEPIDLFIGSAQLYQLACISDPTPGVLFACEDNSLYWLDFTPGDFSQHKSKLVTRFSSAVYCVTTDRAGQWIAAGAADFTIKLLPTAAVLATSKHTCHVLDMHSAPVLSLSFSSDGLTLCSTSCDGQLILWSTSDRTVRHKLTVLSPKVSDLSLSPSRLVAAISPLTADKCLIATPLISSDGDNTISVYSSVDCTLIDRLSSASDTKASGAFHCCAWSPDGLYLAAGTAMGHILLWSCSYAGRISFQRVGFFKHSLRGEIASVALGLSSQSGSPMLAAFTKSGYLLLHDPVPLYGVASAESAEESLLEGLEAAELFDSQDSPCDSAQKGNQGMELDESSLDSKIETKSIYQPPVEAPERKPAKKRKFIPEWEEDLTAVMPESSNSGHSPRADPGLQRQESFQPSSWPPFSQLAAWEHVCLCYNLIGVAISHRPPGSTEAENEKKHFNFLLEVEFHDRGVHHPLQLLDPHWFSVGVLTEELLLLGGSGRRTDATKHSKDPFLIQAHRFNAWDSSKEWSVYLPEGENAVCLASGSGWVAAVSDCSILRLFGTEGTEFDLLRLPGSPVASAARGNRLIAVYHQNSALLDTQNIGFYLLAVSGMKLVLLTEGSMVLSVGSELRWIGFTPQELPVSLDSAGHLQVGRVNARGILWTPMLDFNSALHKKRNSHKLVILGITPSLSEQDGEETFCSEELRYIVPSHGAQFPSLHPRPSVQCATYRPLFCSSSSDKLSHHQQYFLSCFSHGPVSSLSQERLMQLFASAARSGFFLRAVEVGTQLTPQYKQLAITFSSRLQLPALSQRMSSLLAAAETEPAPTTGQGEDASFHASQEEQGLSLSQDLDSSLIPGEEIAPLLSSLRSTSGRDGSAGIFSSAPTNPFRNQAGPLSRASSIDKNFINSVIQRSRGDKQAHPGSPQTEAKHASHSSKQSKLMGEPVSLPARESAVTSAAENKPVGFREWLEQTLPRLETENPLLKKAELMQLATKLWREEKRIINS